MTAALSVLIPFLGLSLSLSISGTLIGGALLLLFWLSRGSTAPWKETWRASPLSLPLALYMLWGIGVTLAAGSTSVRSMLSDQTTFLIFFPIVYGLSRDQAASLARWICIGAVAAGSLAILQALIGINYLPHLQQYQTPDFAGEWPALIKKYLALRGDRAVGTRSHPLTFAEGLLPAFFILLSLGIARLEERRAAPKIWIGVFIIAAGLFLAQGRAVWAGCAIGTGIVFLWVKGSAGKIVVPAAAALLLGLALLSPVARGRAMSIFSSHGGRAGDQQSKSVRFQIWSEGFTLVRKHPIRGAGIDGVAIQATDPFLQVTRTWSETHNIYLQCLAERGLIGLGLLIWILVCAFRSMNGLETVWKRAGLGFLIAMMIAGLTESWYNDKEIALLFVAMIAIAERHRRMA